MQTLSPVRKIQALTCWICSLQQYVVTSMYEPSASSHLQFPLPASVLASKPNISRNLTYTREHKCLPGDEGESQGNNLDDTDS